MTSTGISAPPNGTYASKGILQLLVAVIWLSNLVTSDLLLVPVYAKWDHIIMNLCTILWVKTRTCDINNARSTSESQHKWWLLVCVYKKKIMCKMTGPSSSRKSDSLRARIFYFHWQKRSFTGTDLDISSGAQSANLLLIPWLTQKLR